MRIGFIGAGKAGFTLGHYFSKKGLDVSGYFSRNTESAEAAAKFTNTRCYYDIESIVKSSDTLFLTVPDGAISQIWDRIACQSIENKMICHVSGALSSRIFTGIEETGAYGYSIHPLYAIHDHHGACEGLSKAAFTIEGSLERIEEMQEMMQKLGNPIHLIHSHNKPKYHLAAVYASNLMIALVQTGTDLLKEACGFSEADALNALYPLMSGNLRHIGQNGTRKALTGPIERGDAQTVRMHMDCLDAQEKLLYQLLSKKLITIAKEKNPDKNYLVMENLMGE